MDNVTLKGFGRQADTDSLQSQRLDHMMKNRVGVKSDGLVIQLPSGAFRTSLRKKASSLSAYCL
jgi:hypothetical protein